MKSKSYLYVQGLLLLLFLLFFSSTVIAQITYIPDPNFEQALIDLGIDSDGVINGQVLTADIDTVKVLNLRYKNISDLTGIEDFAALEDLNIRGNNISTLDTSGNPHLKNLICKVNPLESLNITQNQQLEVLDLTVVHRLDSVNLSGNINLETLILDDCWIHELDISNNINLKRLEASGSSFTEIDLSNNSDLEYLDVFGVHLEEIDVSNNIKLKEFYCGNFDGDMGQIISEIDISNNVNLEMFYAENLFLIKHFNAKNGNNSILQVTLDCFFENNPCELSRLNCIQVDDAEAANNGEFPYNTWFVNADFYYSEDCTLGISTPKENGFMLSENPVHQNLIFTAPGFSGKVNLEIYSVNGKLLKNQSLHFDNQFSIDVSQLAAGVYVLKIIDDTYGVTTKRFIKK